MLLDAEPEGRKAPPPAGAPVLIEGRDVSVTFQLGGGIFRAPTPLHAVRSVGLTLAEGQTIGIVGESGSGKSTLGPRAAAAAARGGKDPLSRRSCRSIRRRCGRSGASFSWCSRTRSARCRRA
jgi:ABC-type microcin C transport system duplicated ATPase subunit YejF